MSRHSMLVLAAALGAATLASAQAPQPQSGFFAPTPGDDPSLTHTLPPPVSPGTMAPAPAPAAPVQPAAAQPAAPPPAAPTTTTTATSDAAQARANIENQMDRSEAEARQAQEVLARQPHINGAFSGLTDERDR